MGSSSSTTTTVRPVRARGASDATYRGYESEVREFLRGCGEIVEIASPVASASVSRPAPDPVRLADAVARELGPGRVDGLRRFSGGASRETWSFDLVHPDGARHGLVLRRDPEGSVIDSSE